MSAQTAAPTSATFERDARIVNARHGDASPGEIAIGVIIGRTSEFFDFFVFAIASVIVFPRLVFPFASDMTGTLYSFMIFALAFMARPIGTVIFMTVDRAYGKTAKLISALFLLGTATVALAFLPGYHEIGVAAIWLLALARIAQGLAWGGAWDGMASLLALNAPPSQRGWYAMVPQLGAPLGLIVASALFAYFAGNLSADDFFDWGWRYPFFVAFAINVVALFARLRMVTTEEYSSLFETRELQPSRISDTVAREGHNIMLGAFAPLASFALFHLVTVFPLSWVKLHTAEDTLRFLLLEAGGAALCVFAIMASGFLADRVGRRVVLGISAVLIGAYSGFAPQLLGAGLFGETIYMVIGFILLGLSFGQSSGAIASNFKQMYRYTASALTSDMAWLFGAGFAPLAALLLATNLGVIASGAYLLSGAMWTIFALWLSGLRESVE